MLQGSFQKKIIHTGLFLFVLFQLIFGVIPGWSGIQSDFPNYYVSGKLVHADSDSVKLYDNSWFQQQFQNHGINAQGKFAPFPPPTAFVLYPLTFLEPLTAKRVWLCFNLLLIAPVIILMHRISGASSALCAFLLTGSGLALANNLMLGQVYLLLLFSMLLSIKLLQSNSRWLPGTLLGGGIAVKYFPLVFIPGLIRCKNRFVLAWIVFTLILVNLSALIVFGLNTYKDFFNSVLFSHLSGELKGQSPWSASFQSWNALAHVLFRYHPLENPDPLSDSGLLYSVVKNGIPALVLLLSGYIMFKIRHVKSYLENSVMLLSSTLLFLTPAGATYHNLLLLLPLTLYLQQFRSTEGLFNPSVMVLFLSLVISGILPLLLNNLQVLTENLLFLFHRLWLNGIFYLVIARQLLLVSGKGNSLSSDRIASE